MKYREIDWFELWREDRESMLNTMLRNMNADLANGYDYFGKSITQQREDIARFKADYDADMDKIGEMEPNKVQHWCYCRLLKLGAI